MSEHKMEQMNRLRRGGLQRPRTVVASGPPAQYLQQFNEFLRDPDCDQLNFLFRSKHTVSFREQLEYTVLLRRSPLKWWNNQFYTVEVVYDKVNHRILAICKVPLSDAGRWTNDMTVSQLETLPARTYGFMVNKSQGVLKLLLAIPEENMMTLEKFVGQNIRDSVIIKMMCQAVYTVAQHGQAGVANISVSAKTLKIQPSSFCPVVISDLSTAVILNEENQESFERCQAKDREDMINTLLTVNGGDPNNCPVKDILQNDGNGNTLEEIARQIALVNEIININAPIQEESPDCYRDLLAVDQSPGWIYLMEQLDYRPMEFPNPVELLPNDLSLQHRGQDEGYATANSDNMAAGFPDEAGGMAAMQTHPKMLQCEALLIREQSDEFVSELSQDSQVEVTEAPGFTTEPIPPPVSDSGNGTLSVLNPNSRNSQPEDNRDVPPDDELFIPDDEPLPDDESLSDA